MRKSSRFIKIAVSAGLVVSVGAGVLGITSFASAKISEPAQSQTTSKRVSPLGTIATALSMTEAELRTELVAGKSIAQVAQAKNIDVQVVVDAITTKRKIKIASHVADGKLTQAQADAKLAQLETRVNEMVTKPGLSAKGGPGGRPDGRPGGKYGSGSGMSEEVAKVLNLTATELMAQLREGKSLAVIAAAQNVEISKVKDVLRAQFKTGLDQKVASGDLTQEQADGKLAQFELRIDDKVNRVGPQGGPGGKGNGMRPSGGFMGGQASVTGA